MDYTRGKIWSSFELVTADDLNAEFDRIATVINGSLEQTNFQAGELQAEHIVNAGDSRFAPLGTETNATRVKNAIAEADGGSSPIKVVFVPKSMWGYAGDADYSTAMYKSGVLLVREGAPGPWYDPVAYGAKIGDVNVNDTPGFQRCFDDAALAGSFSKIVAVTLPGAYQLNTNVTRPAGVGLWTFPGVTYTGAGAISGGPNRHDFPAAVTIPRLVTKFISAVDADTVAGSSELVKLSPALAYIQQDTRDYRLLYVRARIRNTTVGTPFKENWVYQRDEITGAEVVDNLVLYRVQALSDENALDNAKDDWTVGGTIKNLSGSAQNFEIETQILLIKNSELAE